MGFFRPHLRPRFRILVSFCVNCTLDKLKMPPTRTPFFFFWILDPALQLRCYLLLEQCAEGGLFPVVDVVPSNEGFFDSPRVVDPCSELRVVGPCVGLESVGAFLCVRVAPVPFVGTPSLSLKKDGIGVGWYNFPDSPDILVMAEIYYAQGYQMYLIGNVPFDYNPFVCLSSSALFLFHLLFEWVWKT